MNNFLTLGQQLAMSASSTLAANYADPYDAARDAESKNVRAAANLTLLVESIKSAIRKQIADNLVKGETSTIVTHKVMSTAVCYDILAKDVLALHAASLHITTVWEGFLNWLRTEGLTLDIDNVGSAASVRTWYEIIIRVKN